MTWTLNEDFSDSAMRSYSAAALLKSSGDLATSSHLFGVAAECALKATLERANIVVDKKSKLREHIPKLIDNILYLGYSRHMGAVAPSLDRIKTYFSDYSIDTRYAAENAVDSGRGANWESGALLTLQVCGFN